MVTSASIALADREHGDAFYFLERQLVAAAMGLAAGFCMVKIPTRLWQSLGSWLAGGALALLVHRPHSGRGPYRQWQHAVAERGRHEHRAGERAGPAHAAHVRG